MTDPHNLQRFVEAQAHTYESALTELRQGRKTSHWMWFIFPQLEGLGRSPMAQRYAISSLAEAAAYLRHPILGPGLEACVRAVLDLEKPSAREIFGSIDEAKFRSSLTLFAEAAPDNPIFREALRKYFEGGRDPLTLERLRRLEGTGG